jgi:predicted ATPase/ElaB/YqjD/DUF883 family membrane-anchored ribosome-binding protein
MDNFKKGSLWNKWDLQIHTPETKLSDNYKVDKGIDVWDKFIDYLKHSDVSVFGITDYFSIDNYEKVIEKTKSVKELQDKIFFPNIEFRLDISSNKNSEEINIHLVFDNKYKIENIKNFLNNLETSNTKSNGTHYHCTPEDLSSLGYDKACISLKSLQSALKTTFGKEKPYLIIGASNGMGGIRADKKSARKMGLSDEVDKFCDLFFGRAQDCEYFLKEDRYEDKDTKADSKAVVTSSDCHSFEDCENYLGKQFKDGNVLVKDITWVKANTTFEGLRQILYEPSERVSFGYERPEQKKTYYLIDKVKFIEKKGKEIFSPEYLEINSNLITIIGGKSTGKSLLLYYIAKTIDPQEVKMRLEEQQKELPYDFDLNSDFNFEVTWVDGEKTYFKNNSNIDNLRKILYIPQNYLNKLSETNIKSKDTLNKFILDVLLQNDDMKEKYETNISKIKALNKSIPNSIITLFQIKTDISEIEDNIKKLGKEKGIQTYLDQLLLEADTIKKKSGLNDTEIKEYEALLENEKTTETIISDLVEDNKNLKLFKQVFDEHLTDLIGIKDEQIDLINDVDIKKEFEKEFTIYDNLNNEFTERINKVIKSIKDKADIATKKIVEIKGKLKPYLEKVKLQSELIKKNNAIKGEKKKLTKLTTENKSLDKKNLSYEKEKKSLIETYNKIFGIYEENQKEFEIYENNIDDISLKVAVGFDEKKFNNDVIHSSINKIDIKKVISGINWKDEYEYQYESNKHLKFISNIVDAVIDEKIKTIKNKSIKEAIVKLLEDYFKIDFKISYKGDSIDKMSPGKKGLVLLRLLIDLSNQEWPILLDQPEDDLDNRSVYESLVTFIKKKKKSRQIIIVTHNPNLVVGADAEEVIVANQEGQEKSRDNKKYKFEYVSGALENTFEFTEAEEKAILFRKGIRQHVCDILEGGKEAFQKREKKYSFL